MEVITEGLVRYSKSNNAVHWRDYYNWQLYINKAWRDAELVAVKDFHFLFEYEMPSGKSFLTEIGLTMLGEFDVNPKSVSRKKLPKKWQDAEWL